MKWYKKHDIKTTEGMGGEQAAKMRGQLAFAACGAVCPGFFSILHRFIFSIEKQKMYVNGFFLTC